MRKIIFLLIILFLSSCAVENQMQKFEVKAGKHRSNPQIYIGTSNDSYGIKFKFKTNETWDFDIPENNGWSKLFGLSSGWNNHDNSARFVFRQGDDGLWLGGYCYYNGKSPQDDNTLKTKLHQLELGKFYYVSIERILSIWQFKVYEDGSYHPNKIIAYWGCSCGDTDSRLWIYKPYIGGIYTLKKDWKTMIRFNWIKK